MSSLRSGPLLAAPVHADRPGDAIPCESRADRPRPVRPGSQMERSTPKAGARPHNSPLILVIADDPAQAAWLTRTLERQGHRCVGVEPGQDPLALVRDCEPGLVLCDSSGGGSPGATLCAALKADPALRRIPVLLAGEFERASDLVHGLQCGADHLIFKPFDARYLRARIAFVQANRQLLEPEAPRSGVGVRVSDSTAFIAADRRQLLNLLFSTFEATVETQRLLHGVRAERDQLRSELDELRVERSARSASIGEPGAPYLARIVVPSPAADTAGQDTDPPAPEARARLLATLDGRLRPPLHELVAASEQLAHDATAVSNASLATVRDNAALLLGLLDELTLDAAGPAAELPLSHAPLALAELVEELCTSVLPRAARHGVNLTVFVSPEVPPRVLADELRLRQVLHHLVENALLACTGLPGRRGRISVRTELEHDGDTPQLALRIADNGNGIATDTLDALLDARGGGERGGQSLAVCLRLTRRMGGELRAASVPGEGSVFTLRFPLVAAAAPVLPLQQDLGGIECILVADPGLAVDDLRTYLQHAGASVQQVGDLAAGEQAAALRGQPVVLIRQFDGRRPDQAQLRQLHAAAPQVRHLLVTRGRRRYPRLEAEHCVTLDGDALSRAALLQAVALAAGDGVGQGPAGIDPEVLRRQFGNHPTAAGERLADFYLAARQQLDALRASVDGNDYEQATRLAERMRDACRAVGARALERECSALAESARREEQAAVRQQLPALERALVAIERELAARLGRSSGATPG